MHHIHYEFEVGPEEGILVTMDRRANVLLMDDENYANYAAGKAYRYHGGYPKQRPVYLKPPAPGRWHLAIDLGGYPGSVRARAEVVPDVIDDEPPPAAGTTPNRDLNQDEVIEFIRERVGEGGRVIVEVPDRGYFGLLPKGDDSFRLVPITGGRPGDEAARQA